MSDLRQAAMLALDALENHTAIKHPQQIHYRDAAIDALRSALNQAELVGSVRLESMQVRPSEFIRIVEGEEAVTGIPVYWAEWPNKENT